MTLTEFFYKEYEKIKSSKTPFLVHFSGQDLVDKLEDLKQLIIFKGVNEIEVLEDSLNYKVNREFLSSTVVDEHVKFNSNISLYSITIGLPQYLHHTGPDKPGIYLLPSEVSERNFKQHDKILINIDKESLRDNIATDVALTINDNLGNLSKDLVSNEHYENALLRYKNKLLDDMREELGNKLDIIISRRNSISFNPYDNNSDVDMYAKVLVRASMNSFSLNIPNRVGNETINPMDYLVKINKK